MKVQFDTLQAMRRDIRVVAEHFGFLNMQRQFKKFEVSTAFSLWFKVYANRTYPSDNPNVQFVGHGRLLRYDPEFKQYPDDTNDDTIKTALLKVCRELFA